MDSRHHPKIILMACGLCFILCATIAWKASAGEPSHRRTAPVFILSDTNGQKVHLVKERGKLVFLTFFAEYCVPCREEVPILNKLKSEFPFELKVYGIGFQQPSAVKLGAVARDFKMNYPALVDAEGYVARMYSVTALPTAIFIDQNGRIVETVHGTDQVERLSQDIRRRARVIRAARQGKTITYVAPLTEVTSGAKKAKLGSTVQRTLAAALEKSGYVIAPEKDDATILITGSVTSIAGMVGVEVTLARSTNTRTAQSGNSGKATEPISVQESVMNSDYAPLTKRVVEAMARLR